MRPVPVCAARCGLPAGAHSLLTTISTMSACETEVPSSERLSQAKPGAPFFEEARSDAATPYSNPNSTWPSVAV
ncbi:hypothetical protein HYQ46_007689 [Verticillium longisporum]|nr:hypothetical protein HYQ46_007689 [Verticillium longisporum]